MVLLHRHKQPPDFSGRCKTANQAALRSGYLSRILPGSQRRGKELVAATIRGGKGDSFSLNYETGQWSDFATGEKGGDLIALMAAREGLDQGQALEKIEVELGLDRRQPLPPKTEHELPKAPTSGQPTKVWVYADADNQALYEAHRWEKPGHKKTCRMHNAGGKERVPLYLPQIMEAIQGGRPVYIAEGEPKADLLWTWGLAGTCVIGGVNGWRPEIAKWFKTAEVVIIPDADEPGRKFGQQIVKDLTEAKSVKIVGLPSPKFVGYDLVDWHKDGGTAEQFNDLVDAVPTESEIASDIFAENCLLVSLEQGAQPFQWLLEGSMRKKQLGLICGPPGCGKGIFALQMAVIAALGQSIFGRWQVETPLRVLYVSAEDDRQIINNRLNAIWDSLPPEKRDTSAGHRMVTLPLKGHVHLCSRFLKSVRINGFMAVAVWD